MNRSRFHLKSTLSLAITFPFNNIIVSVATVKKTHSNPAGEGRGGRGVTDEENGFGGGLAVDLLQVLGLEGDHANEAVDHHQVGEDHQRVHAVAEESSQRWNEIWSRTHTQQKFNPLESEYKIPNVLETLLDLVVVDRRCRTQFYRLGCSWLMFKHIKPENYCQISCVLKSKKQFGATYCGS